VDGLVIRNVVAKYASELCHSINHYSHYSTTIDELQAEEATPSSQPKEKMKSTTRNMTFGRLVAIVVVDLGTADNTKPFPCRVSDIPTHCTKNEQCCENITFDQLISLVSHASQLLHSGYRPI
jgi:hypothetical protein